MVKGAVIIDGPNLNALHNDLGLWISYHELPGALESWIARELGVPCALLERVIAVPPLIPTHPNATAIQKFYYAVQPTWRVEGSGNSPKRCGGCGTLRPDGEDDQLLLTLLMEFAARYDLVVLGTGDGRLLHRAVKALHILKPELWIVVLSTRRATQSYHCSWELRQAADAFIDLADLPCVSRCRPVARLQAA